MDGWTPGDAMAGAARDPNPMHAHAYIHPPTHLGSTYILSSADPLDLNGAGAQGTHKEEATNRII